MVEQSKMLARKLLDLMQETGYPLVQHNGQRKYGPPPDWKGPPPQRGTEVFVGKLPREIFEDELVPAFSKVGKIYELRLMMDFSGSNRGYAFVTYTNKGEANKAVKELNGYEIRPGRHIGVTKSVDNCRLFVGRIPNTKTKEEIQAELVKRVDGIVEVILYKNCFDRRLNRGFAFVEFVSHRAAAMARRELVPGCVRLWGEEVTVDWAEPEPDIDDELMKNVKVLYVRNFMIETTPDTIKSVFEAAISSKIERVKKIYDYAFIHFYERDHAELAMHKLQNAEIDGINIEIKWAKPVEREMYRIQKQRRGNAKFNRSFNLSQTLWLYKQHKEKREYVSSPKEDEGIGSGYAGSCGSPMSIKPWGDKETTQKDYYRLPPAKLEALCNRYLWDSPLYRYQNYMDPCGVELWVARVDLPQVGSPLLAVPRSIGPLFTNACFTQKQAQVEAAAIALAVIQGLQCLRSSSMQQTSQTSVQPLYPTMVSPMVTYPYVTSPMYGSGNGTFCSTQVSLQVPAMWRNV